MAGPVGGAPPLGAAFLAESRRRLAKGFPDQIRECLERLQDGQVWWRPHEEANAVGNLVLHVCGSSRHYLGRLVGGRSYERDRPAEFAERGPVTRAELFRLLDDTAGESAAVLDALDPGTLLETREVPREKPQTVFALGRRTTHHWAAHTGQIVYATKLLTSGGLADLWMKTML